MLRSMPTVPAAAAECGVSLVRRVVVGHARGEHRGGTDLDEAFKLIVSEYHVLGLDSTNG